MRSISTIIACWLIMSLNTATATTVLPLSLEKLSTRASLIFHARAISNEVRKDAISGQIATFTEFEIIELIKGEAGERYTIKQIGGRLNQDPVSGRQVSLRVHGVPRFKAGEEYVVFLPPPSSLGFNSPLGLHQGRFNITTSNGEKVVSNGRSMSARYGGENHYYAVQQPLAVNPENTSRAMLPDFINTVRAYNIQ